MALNIKPGERIDTNEIANLIYWNIPFLQGGAFLLLLIGLQHTFFHFNNALRVALSVLFILAGLNLISLSRSEKKYITSESGKDLALSLSALGSFWKTYSFVLVFSLASLINMSGKGAQYYLVPPVVAVLLFWSFSKEKKRLCSQTELTSCISTFAVVNVGRVRFVALFSLVVGFTFFVLYILSYFIKIALSDTTALLWSISYLGIGTGAGLYWRKVRDIHRNPSVIYFERSLERLNLYWLVFAVFSLVQCVANFF